jgi:hypothetical protein
MNKLGKSLLGLLAATTVVWGLAGCEGSHGDDSGSNSSSDAVPAAGLNVNGFWEGVLSDGSTAAGTLAQSNATVTSYAKIGDMGQFVGTLNGFHIDFTFAHDSGVTESGSGDFSTDGLTLTANLPSVGSFQLLWRGPDFDHHDQYGEPLTYSK